MLLWYEPSYITRTSSTVLERGCTRLMHKITLCRNKFYSSTRKIRWIHHGNAIKNMNKLLALGQRLSFCCREGSRVLNFKAAWHFGQSDFRLMNCNEKVWDQKAFRVCIIIVRQRLVGHDTTSAYNKDKVGQPFFCWRHTAIRGACWSIKIVEITFRRIIRTYVDHRESIQSGNLWLETENIIKLWLHSDDCSAPTQTPRPCVVDLSPKMPRNGFTFVQASTTRFVSHSPPFMQWTVDAHWCHHVNRNIALQPSFVRTPRIHYHHDESKQFSRPQNISLSLFHSAFRLILPGTDSTCSREKIAHAHAGCFYFFFGHEKSLLIVCEWMTWGTTRLRPSSFSTWASFDFSLTTQNSAF